MKRLGCRNVSIARLVPIVWFAILLVLAGDDLRREIVSGPVARTQPVAVASLPPGSYLTIGEGQLHMAAFSPDGRTLATAGPRGLKFYDPAAFQLRLNVPIASGADELAWSPDGRALAVIGGDAKLMRFDTATGEQTWAVDLRDRTPRGLAWSADGRHLAATVLGTKRRDVWIWDAQTGERRFELPSGSRLDLAPASAVSWSPADNRLAIAYAHSGSAEPAGGRQELQVWQIGDEPVLAGNWPLDGSGVRQLAWGADGRSLLVLNAHSLRLLDSQSGETRAEADSDLSLARFALSPDGASLVAADDASGTLFRFSAPALERTGRNETGLSAISSLGWSPDGSSVVVTERDSDLFQVWSWADVRLPAEVLTESPQAAGLAWSPAGPLLAVAAYNGLVHLYDGATGERIRTLGDEASREEDMAWSFDGRLLAISGSEPTGEEGQYIVQIWSAGGALKTTLPGDLLAWANRSNRILIAPYSRGELTWLTQLWAVTPEGQTALQSEFEIERWRWAVSPDDQWVVTVEGLSAPDTKLVVWELETRRVVAELTGENMSYVDTLAWSPDGAWLAALYYYDCPLELCARLEVWDTATWQSHKTFGRLPHTPRTISWSADSRWIAAGVSPNGFALTLYPLDDQQRIRELDYPLTEHDIVTWSPDGRQIATTSLDSGDGRVIIWQAEALLP